MLFWTVLLVIIPLGLTSLIVYQKGREIVREEVHSTLEAVARGMAAQVSSLVQGKMTRVRDFASDGFVRGVLARLDETPGRAGLTDSLRSHLRTHKAPLDPDILDIAVFNRLGKTVVNTGEGFSAMLDRAPVSSFTEASGVFAGPVEEVSGVRLFTITASMPAEGGSGLMGAIAVSFRASAIDDILASPPGGSTPGRGPRGLNYMVDRGGAIIAADEAALVGGQFSADIVRRSMAGMGNASGEFIGPSGVETVGAAAHLEPQGWTVVATMPSRLAFAPIDRLAVAAISFILAGVGVVIALTVIMTRRITGSVLGVASAAGRIADGHLDERIRIRGSDEIAHLGRAFNEMAERLKGSFRVIGAREKSLENSERKYRTLIENLPQRIYLKDTASAYVSCNNNYAEDHAISADEIAGKSDYDLYPMEIADKYRADDRRVMASGAMAELEEVYAREGHEFFIHTVKVPVRDDSGAPAGILGIFWDITEEKRREDETRLLFTVSRAINEAPGFHAALEAALKSLCVLSGWVCAEAWLPAPDGGAVEYAVGWCNGDGPLREFLDASTGLMFNRGSALPGRVWASGRSEWVKDVTINHSVFLRAPSALKAGLKAGLGVPISSGERVLAVLVFFMAEAREEDARLVDLVTAVSSQLGPVVLKKLAEDERSEMQKRFEDLVNNVPVGVYRASGAKGMPFGEVNPAMVDMFEAGSKGEMLVRGVADFCVDGERLAEIARRLETDGSVNNEAMEFSTLKGGRFWGSVSGRMKAGAAGATWIDGVIEDITEQKRLEEQLRQSQKMEAIGTLAGGIAHDFNNILTAMVGYGNLLKMKRGEDALTADYAGHILTLSEKAAGLTQGLLAFSRKQVLNAVPVDLNDIVGGVGRLLSRVIGEDIELKTSYEGTRLTVTADTSQLELVLLNLVTNARDAMPRGGSLTISTRLIDLDERFIRAHGYGAEGRYALLTVEDTGSGMDERTRERVFEPFFTTKEVGKGTGLGLSMAYGIVKQHNGFINVYSEPGRGSTFRIYLPISDASPSMAGPEEPVTVMGGSETILLAEDEEEVRLIAKTFLEEFGYRVIAAVDGEDAVERFMEEKDEIGLVVLDLVMPRKGGMEALTEMRKARPDVKAVFVSGYASEISGARGEERQGAVFISKPVAPTELLRKIREVLD
jgi:PAS domain S-box-containing protein